MVVTSSYAGEDYAFKRNQLPCTRSLWSAKSNVDWQRLYVLQASKRKSSDPLKMAHLLEYSKPVGGESVKKRWMADLETWCLDHDNFGTLIWSAIKLDPVGIYRL